MILAWAALLGWLPFRLIDRFSLVDEIDATNAGARRSPTSSRVACLRCGRLNETAYSYCASCGRKLLDTGIR
jgi:hypothetical protein